MKVSVQEIRQKMAAALRKKGYSPEDVEFLIEMYLGGEQRGHTSHGLANFASFVQKDTSGLAEPEVLKETNALFMIDAKSNSGSLLGKRAADEAIARARKEIVGVALVKNMESWLRPGAIAQYIADQGFVGVVINDGGGTSIAPPGGYDPTLGTNPIAYGIPTASGALVVDMAASKRAWGQVRLANKYGTDLPPDTFYNKQGEITRDPKEAYSVLPFGEHKGYALALLVEVLCGSLLGKGMMIQSTEGDNFGAKFPDRGGVILVLDPSQTAGLNQFEQDNTAMIDKIKSTHPIPGQTIRIPGERAGKLQKTANETDVLDLPDELWDEISKL